MTKDEALDLALEVLKINLTLLEKINPYKGQEDLLSDSLDLTHKAITAIKQARSAPVQEPVAWVPALHTGHYITITKPPESWGMVPLYTAQPAAQRQWVGLTDEDLTLCESEEDVRFVRAIEAKLKEKNGM
jgi:hypothetical protein